ncbi:MAG: RNA chaperone Hfq [Thermoplasmatales archaeon]|nr:RNA chaperone Hfq [Thermoplasmatales archaeon]
MEDGKMRYLHHKIDNTRSGSMSTISEDRDQDALVPGEVNRMSESIDATNKELTNSHGNDPEKSAPNFRYQTIYPGQIDNFGKQLIGKMLTLELVNGKTITGKLASFGQYDIILIDSRTGQNVLVFKHAIVSVMGDLTAKR